MIPIKFEVLRAILADGYAYMRTNKGIRKITIDDLAFDKKIMEKIELLSAQQSFK